MKHSFFFALIILISFGFQSCQNKDQSISPQGGLTSGSTSLLTVGEPRKRLYCATWDEWGRKSKKCGGWGLCNFKDCWFCTCDQADKKALVVYDDNLQRFNMTIELAQTDSQQIAAISSNSPLIIDEDIISDNLVVKKGSYPFKQKVGSFGGYIIPAYER
jgi:hypothetical protein